MRTILRIEKADYISPFGWIENREYNMHILNVFRLREKSELQSGRVTFYICPECGKIDCGAVTGIIEDHTDRVVWKDFGFEDEYGVSERLKIKKPIEFERKEYLRTWYNYLVEHITS